MYDLYFDFLGQTIIISTEGEPSDFVDGFWIYIDDEMEAHLSVTPEENEYLIPSHRIIAFRKNREEGE